MTFAATAAVERLIDRYGVDAVVDALLVEAETAPDDHLDALERMLDAVMAGFIAEAGSGRRAAS